MRVRILHRTEYRYDRPVWLEPHLLRLTPRFHPRQTPLERSLKVFPEPAGLTEILDLDGLPSHLAYFKDPCSGLTIESSAVLELKPINPFDFILYPLSGTQLPMQYPSETAALLAPFSGSADASPSVRAFADELLKESRGKTLDFMTALCARIQSRFSYEVRPAGEPASPERTLTSLRGSCRDFVVLAIATARSAGLACRFVSGYCIPEKPSGPPELHAWMEVYLCGGGWRGFDPTLGLACQENHIALATGPSSAMAMPVQGTFRGDARSEMEVTLAYEKQ
jgi:transglutaminase-like putative cysteine protease